MLLWPSWSQQASAEILETPIVYVAAAAPAVTSSGAFLGHGYLGTSYPRSSTDNIVGRSYLRGKPRPGSP